MQLLDYKRKVNKLLQKIFNGINAIYYLSYNVRQLLSFLWFSYNFHHFILLYVEKQKYFISVQLALNNFILYHILIFVDLTIFFCSSHFQDKVHQHFYNSNIERKN